MKCECQQRALLQPEWAFTYDPVNELPFVTHGRGECYCTNSLHRFICADGKTRTLCSCCYTPDDIPLGDEARQ